MERKFEFPKPEYLRMWKYPSNYLGATWEDYYVFMSQHRDSDELTQSNFQVALERIGGEYSDGFGEEEGDNPSNNVVVVHETHWAVGWVEWIAIHKDCMSIYKSPRSKGEVWYREVIDEAEEILDYLENEYPILDEQHFSDLEYENLLSYLESRFTGTEDEKREKINRYMDECQGFNVEDSDEDLIDEIENEEEEED